MVQIPANQFKSYDMLKKDGITSQQLSAVLFKSASLKTTHTLHQSRSGVKSGIVGLPSDKA